MAGWLNGGDLSPEEERSVFLGGDLRQREGGLRLGMFWRMFWGDVLGVFWVQVWGGDPGTKPAVAVQAEGPEGRRRPGQAGPGPAGDEDEAGLGQRRSPLRCPGPRGSVKAALAAEPWP